MSAATLVLRDVHVPDAPALWPPAPGWWIVGACILLLCIAIGAWGWHRRQRLRRWQRWFDEAVPGRDAAPQVAAMSELLKRASRRVQPNAERLEGDAWLRFLDGARGHAFSQGPGRLLLEGGYRRDVDVRDVDALRQVARARFLQLMAGTR